MNPDNSNSGGDLQDQLQGGQSQDNPSADSSNTQSQQDSAANVIRTQIDGLYSNTDETQPAAEESHPYQRTHSQHPLPEAEQWKQYHSAWQNYYQKYYENFYTAQASQTQNTSAGDQSKDGYFSNQPAGQAPAHTEEISNDEALVELRQKLLGRVQSSADKIRKSRHFIPIISALAVVLIFVFIQYNQVFIANVKAYVSPGSIDPQNIVVDPTTDVVVSQDPRLIIPKINVDVPVLYDVGIDNDSQMAAMTKGVAHFPIPGANSHPGEVGNTVLAGHSSNDLFEAGDYKFIFAQLEKLSVGDSIYANYQGKRYTYVVTKMEVVKPNEVNKLIYPTDKPVLTLITCTPLGTALNRLLVTAEQVSPDPAAAATAPAGSGTGGSAASIPGDNGTLFEKLFGR